MLKCHGHYAFQLVKIGQVRIGFRCMSLDINTEQMKFIDILQWISIERSMKLDHHLKHSGGA